MVRRLAALVVAWAVLIAGPALVGPAVPVALGHAQLVSSSPGSGEVVSTAPPELRLVFSEPLDSHYSQLDLVGPDGEAVAMGIGAVDTGDPYMLVAPLAAELADGLYTVEWRSLSAADGHTASGFFTFGVGDVAPPAAASDSGAGSVHAGHDAGTALLETESRVVGNLGFLLAAGLPAIAWLVLRERRSIGLAKLAGGGLVAGAIGAVGLLVLAGTAPGMDLITYATASRTGSLLLIRAVVGAAGGAIVLGLAGRRPDLALVGAAFVALPGLGLLAISGHAAAYAAPGPALAVLVHLVAGAIWLTGVLVLAWLAIADRRPDRPLDELVPRFSALALVAVGLVSLSGLYSDWVQTRGFVSLDTPYATALTVKIALALGAFALGGRNYLGRRRADSFRGTVGIEATLAILVVVATGVVASGSPPAQERPIEIARAVSSAGAVERPPTFELAPGRPGPTRFIVTSDAVPPGGSVELALARLDSGEETRIPLRPGGALPPGHQHAGASPVQYLADGGRLAANSRWDASVITRDAGGTEVSRSRFAFALDSAGISEGRAVPAIDPALVIALVLLVLAVVGVTFALSGGSLPRVEPSTGRVSLLAGCAVSGALGLAILIGGLNL